MMAAPHTRPSTMIGAPTPVRKPNSRIRAAAGPEALSSLSIRAGLPLRSTIAATFSPSNEKRSPTGIVIIPGSSRAASSTAAPSAW
jgi:hypothetical protein